MKAPDSNNPDITNLKPRDYQAFFDVHRETPLLAWPSI